jgi:protein-L-isoaspartate(D-aspartate) O-methyltransferase
MAAVDDAAKRDRMVREQLERRGVRDARVLAAMRRVPRHLFVPAAQQDAGYDDRALPIGEGQTISQPYMVAVMTAELALTETARVLEIGTGSGYQAAVLAAIAAEVISMERRADLATRARTVFETLGIRNVEVVIGDGSAGYPSRAPYDAIVVTAGAPRVPPALPAQLAIGGRLVVPVGTPSHQDLVILSRRPDGYDQRLGDACVFVPLIGEGGWSDPEQTPGGPDQKPLK